MTKTTSFGDCTTSNTLLYAAVSRGTPNVMHRSPKPRLQGPSAGLRRRCSAAAVRRACASGVYGGMRPFGGSMISEVRRSKSRGGSQNAVVVAGLGVVRLRFLVAGNRVENQLVAEQKRRRPPRAGAQSSARPRSALRP